MYRMIVRLQEMDVRSMSQPEREDAVNEVRRQLRSQREGSRSDGGGQE